MTQALHDFFNQHAENAIAGMKQALLAQIFYKRLLPRLVAGEDLSDEIPVLAKVGQKQAIKVVKQAIEENQTNLQTVWNLPQKLQKVGKQEVRLQQEPYEPLPRVQLTFRYPSSAGEVVVRVKTMGENISISWTTPRNKMAAELGLRELEKEASFALLAS